MKLFRVCWEIDVDATSEEQAARVALHQMREPDPDRIDNVFVVREHGCDEFVTIDLDQIDGRV